MSDIHIERSHHFTHAQARKVAYAWAEQVEAEYGMSCTYEEDAKEDLVTFERTGVHGTLRVCGERFELQAKLGFLLGAFRHSIEAEIVKRLDDLLAQPAVKSTRRSK